MSFGKIKNALFVLSLIMISGRSFAAVDIDVGVVLGGYHRHPAVREVYERHRSPYAGIQGNVELVNEEPTILPYDEGCTEFCDRSYIVVDHVRIGGVLYPVTSVVVMNRRHTKVESVRVLNDINVANRWHTRVVGYGPGRERVVVQRHWYQRRVPERNVYVVRTREPEHGHEQNHDHDHDHDHDQGDTNHVYRVK